MKKHILSCDGCGVEIDVAERVELCELCFEKLPTLKRTMPCPDCGHALVFSKDEEFDHTVEGNSWKYVSTFIKRSARCCNGHAYTWKYPALDPKHHLFIKT